MQLKDNKIEELTKRIDIETANLAKMFKDLTAEQDKKKLLEHKISTLETEYRLLKEELANLEVLLSNKQDSKRVIYIYNYYLRMKQISYYVK